MNQITVEDHYNSSGCLNAIFIKFNPAQDTRSPGTVS